MNKNYFSSSDTLVIFGEQFPGGYVNGLVQAAQSKGMQIIYSTVGRRSEDGSLCALGSKDLPSNTIKKMINVPLEAGFDMEPSESGVRPVDLCNKVGIKEWETACLDSEILQSARRRARESFRQRTTQWVQQLSDLLPTTGNVLIAHTMAGGVPRSRVFMPILNRVLKGSGARFFSSEIFWKSDLGQLCQNNFSEVTAQTYRHLIELSQELRDQLKKQGREVFYTAYSYHGAEVLIGDQYQWQSYAPYLQGFAKLELENISNHFFKAGVNSCIFNVPEILTKSSAVFPGVEIPLYTLLGALEKSGGQKGKTLISLCLQKIKPHALDRIMNITKEYFLSPAIQKQTVFEKWPQHNTAEHIYLMLDTSQKLADLHIDISKNITPVLSQAVLESCGRIILQKLIESSEMRNRNVGINRALPAGSDPRGGVCWIGHESIVQDTH